MIYQIYCNFRFLLCGLFAVVFELYASEISIKSGDSIAFLGDSITAFGNGNDCGYVNLVVIGLHVNGIDVKKIPAGVGGNTSKDMLERLQKSVLDKKPNWMTLSCGVNDVWHGAQGVPIESFKENITKIVEQTMAAGIKVMIFTATMIGEDANNANNRALENYNNFLRKLAFEMKLPLADLNENMHQELARLEKESKTDKYRLTRDGVHMNPWGDIVMATGILRAFGLTNDQLDKAYDCWMNNVKAEIPLKVSFTLIQLNQLQKTAAGKNIMLLDMLNTAAQTAANQHFPANQ